MSIRSTNSIMSRGSSSPLATAMTSRLGWEMHHDMDMSRLSHRPGDGAIANAVIRAAVAAFSCNLSVAASSHAGGLRQDDLLKSLHLGGRQRRWIERVAALGHCRVGFPHCRDGGRH